MWQYEKKLQYPVKIKNPNPKYAQIIISQLGGPDGEVGASLRYLTQRFAMPYPQVVGILTDVGTEELAHIEMVSAICDRVAIINNGVVTGIYDLNKNPEKRGELARIFIETYGG